jgi:adenosylcobinamide-GDP ribazoletransferase
VRAEPRRITNEWQAFWLAVGFLTRIPMLARINYSQKLMNQCSMYFDPDKSKSKPVAEGVSRKRLLVSGLFTALVALIFSLWLPGLWLAALTAIITVALLWGWYLQRQLGGYTGDALGASVVFCELVLLSGV